MADLSNDSNYELWEYHTEFIEANATDQKEALVQKFPGLNFSKFAVQAILPRLNEMGEQGWELLQLEPIFIGTNDDFYFPASQTHFSHTYLCVFKRRKRS